MNRSIGNHFSKNISPTYTIYDAASTGTYFTPSGCVYIIVEMIGGGGGGGYILTNGVGGGGGSSFYLKLLLTAGVYEYSVGEGGLAGSPLNDGNGETGGDTFFGAAVSRGGDFGRNDGAGGLSGLSTPSGQVLYSVRGNFGGTILNPEYYNAGGGSFLGGSIPHGTASNTIPTTAGGYGVGGVGSNGDLTSPAQNGSRGRIVITEYYY